MNRLKPPTVESMERWPRLVRALLGCVAACIAVSLNYAVHPLRAFPLLLALPAVILVSWFLGMWGGALAAITDVVLIDRFFTRPESRLVLGSEREEFRLALFLFVSIFLGWTIRRLAQQRALLATERLQQQLMLADSERQLAEERARASTALRDREEILQIALQANGMGLWVWDLEKGAVHRSDEMFRMLGCEPGSFSQDPDEWLNHVHPDDRAGLVDEFTRLQENAADYHRQYRVVWPDGNVHWLESQGKCQKDSEGRPARIMGVTADITHRKVAEEAMLRAEKLAVAGKLAASVAHEINNPLAAVANLLYLITLTQSSEQAHAHAREALDALMRVSLITQQTLKFHRQTGAPKMTVLSEIVESMLALFRGRLRAGEIEVDLRIRRESPVPCLAGETQQVFANLISNAIEAMPRDGRLTIRLSQSRDWRDRATMGMRITVGDSGGGMDRGTMRRIFEPFFTTKTETGTGLGLWVVAQLVERHKGQVRVWSSQRPGASGTAFSVFLPFGPEGSTDDAIENAVEAVNS